MRSQKGIGVPELLFSLVSIASLALGVRVWQAAARAAAATGTP